MFISSTGTCNANNKLYNDGEFVTFHNITYPIEQAFCTICDCSAGDFTHCDTFFCDYVGPPTEICDNWITGEEGECCPRCGKNNKH